MNLTAAYPSALWLCVPVLALVVIFRLLRARRKRLEVGSLLIWRRLAAQNAAPRKKRFEIDQTLVLQALAAMLVVGALSFPALRPAAARGRTVFVLIDNGPLSRARVNGAAACDFLKAKAANVLERFSSDDLFYVALSSPVPSMLNSTPADKRQIAESIQKIVPALSGPDAASLRAFALDRARSLGGMPAIVISFQEPAKDAAQNLTWVNPADAAWKTGNVAIVGAGATAIGENTGERRVLVRAANFSPSAAKGEVTLDGGETRSVSIDPGAEATVVFAIPAGVSGPLRIAWRSADGKVDALPEDDSIMLIPHSAQRPRVRFHAALPVLEAFFSSALNAEMVNEQSERGGAIDLEVYLGSVPENIPAESKAALLVAPSSGYRSFFDVGNQVLNWPKARRGEADALNADIPAGDAGIAIPKAAEFLRTGDFKTLLEDSVSGRPLAIKFLDERARPVYALAFVPNGDLPAQRLLDPALAALLARAGLQASRAGAPYSVMRAAEGEARLGHALPLDWRVDHQAELVATGVLDERASNLRFGAPSELGGLDFGNGMRREAWVDLIPWLAALSGIAAVMAQREK